MSLCQVVGFEAERLLENSDGRNILLYGSMYGEACMRQQARTAVAPDQTRGRPGHLPACETEIL